jgi:plastocyanin
MTAGFLNRSWKRMLLCVLLALLASLGLGQAVQAHSETTIVLRIDQRSALVNGSSVTLDTAPVLNAAVGRTFVPVRFIGETLGAYIGWNGDERKVTYLTGDTRIELWIGQTTAMVNGQQVMLDAAPYIDSNNRTLVPLRFVSERLGATVNYDDYTSTVTINADWVGVVVLMQNYAYSPGDLTVEVGTRVTWVNLDKDPHDVYFSQFNSPTIQSGEAFTRTFTVEGTFDYGCSLHPPYMEAMLKVVRD